MKENILARRYARALFELSKEKNILEKIRQEVEFFSDYVQNDRNFEFFLNSQQISKKQKIAAIEKLFQDRVSNLFFNFLLVLLKKNRQTIFPIVAQEFEKLYDHYYKRIRATTITAIPLDNQSVDRVKKVLNQKFGAEVQLRVKTNPDILGGLIIQVDGQIYDGSIASQLNRLKQQLTEDSKLI
ncbi:MAG: F0F1 ATP synthase subunit delta [Calditrichaeota bacterium]|nr:MAG: F0F1 ATP synthase subunit delta [Calditrichota bacterium]